MNAAAATGTDTLGLKTTFRFSADGFVTAPSGANEAFVLDPFLIKEYGVSYPTNFSMRYQQVYNASLFTNLDSSLVYVSTLTFRLESPEQYLRLAWTVPNMQINLCTTSKSADGLSTNFSENVGADDTMVFPHGSQLFSAEAPDGPLQVLLSAPFRYNPVRGNLLMDVRIFDGSGPLDMYALYLEAINSPADEVSREWATNVTDANATGIDSLGLTTIIQFSPIPSLTAEFRPFICQGCPTNVIQISWPSQPSVFQLQQADQPGPNAVWQKYTNQIFGDALGDGWFVWLPLTSAAAHGYYRLVWPGGQ